MENQTPQDDHASPNSSISLEDDIVLPPGQSRSDLYTTRQPRRDVYGPVTSGSFLMMPLELPNAYTAEDPSAGTQPPDDGDSSLFGRRLERYLAEEHIHERLPLGLHPLGVNKATVRRFLPEIIQNVDNDASRAEATLGATTDCDERDCRGSTTTLTCTTSDSSPEAIEAHDHNDAASVLLFPTSFPSYDMIPSFLEPSQADVSLVQPKHVQTSSESHLLGSGTCEEDLEVGRILMQRRRRRDVEKHDKWRVGKHPRVKKAIRLRKRSEELK
ncbi:uncharacterized protein Triagg1_8306 [Trichoderma aggressivum f. europaeum]|uniref:Uncharacterized protein n=1 Tax=Trichoderma aggressivum f. europaeum TaxID=173218 RepID=A0AAE1J455_9HYPO|nr:hypothetical protein Triagg1_8306 [Trichoderma aggressivum f. europaeum]